VAIAVPLKQVIPDGICLVPIGNDGHTAVHHAYRMVDNKGGVGHLALVKGLGADPVLGLLKDPVPAVLAAAHNKVGHHHPASVLGPAQQDPPARIGVFPQKFK
jgi:hypothetical protein